MCCGVHTLELNSRDMHLAVFFTRELPGMIDAEVKDVCGPQCLSSCSSTTYAFWMPVAVLIAMKICADLGGSGSGGGIEAPTRYLGCTTVPDVLGHA